MAKKPVLVVMAAGMGSRYGGLKQIDPVGSCGEAILDFSLFDAHRAGFDTAVIIIKEAIREDFMETVGQRLKKCPMEIRYAYQELDKLPEGYAVPDGRTKPWGTSHAVLCAKNEIDGAPFAVINADDYYGKEAFKVIYDHLSTCTDPYGYCMVGYELGKTVTDNGSVARGICKTDANGYATLKIPKTITPGKYTVSVTVMKQTIKNTLTVKQVLKTTKTVKVKKSAKKLVLKATLKSSKGKAIKGKKIVFKFKGKKYKAKTNKKGIAKVTIKKSILKKLKVGKKYKCRNLRIGQLRTILDFNILTFGCRWWIILDER